MEYGFKHTTSSPYHPKGNGRAEAAVKVAESMLKKADDFHTALILYRNTPPQGQTYSPAQRMFLRRTSTTLPSTDHLLARAMINFSIVKEDILKKRHDSKAYYDKSADVKHKAVKVGSYAAVTRQTMDLWGSQKRRQRTVLYYSYLSWHHDPKEQSPTETCRSTTTYYPTSDGSQPSHSGYDS